MSAVPPFSQAGVFVVTDPWYEISPGVFVGMIPNDSTVAEQNALVLQAIIDLAQSYVGTACPAQPPFWGATIVFPGHFEVPPPVGPNVLPPTDDGSEYFIAQPSTSPQNSNGIIDVGCNWPLHFLGTGNVKLVAYPNSLVPPVLPDMFYVHTNIGQGKNIGGVTFEDLEFSFNENAPGKAAIHLAGATALGTNDGAQNVRMVRCVFKDCPIGVWFEEALQCSMLQCTGTYSSFGGTALMVGGPNNGYEKPFGKDIFITDCIFETNPPLGTTGLNIIAAEHVRLKGVRFDGFTTGILINPGYAGVGQTPSTFNVVRCNFVDVTCFAGLTATKPAPAGIGLVIQPQNGNFVGQLTFVGCTFEPGSDSGITSTSPGPGILVDANGGFIETVRFVSCYSCRWTGPGLSIGTSGGTGTIQNIEVLGGMYAGNNFSSGASAYGIAVYGPTTAVRIVGVSCVGQYKFIQIDQASTSTVQNVGIYVEGGTANVLIEGCDVRENNTYGIQVNGASAAVTNLLIRDCNATGIGAYSSAINVSGTAANLTTIQITNCAGYNDQSVPLTHSFTGGSATFHPYTAGYYGAIEFYVVGASVTITGIKIGTTTTGLLQGSFYLDPTEVANVTWTPSTGSITVPAVGK